MEITDIHTTARRLFEAHGQKAIADAAQKARTFENSGDEEQARTWRRIEAALVLIRGPRDS